MKKILFTLFLLVMGIGAFAQKSYVTVFCTQNKDASIRLSGAIPSNMKALYTPSIDFSVYNGGNCIGDVLNLLADNGFAVEQMNTVYYDAYVYSTYLLSKTTTGTNPADAIQRVQANPDEEVREVARYNLQGLPVSQDEKGIQIIVYSNYTTKTVIKE